MKDEAHELEMIPMRYVFLDVVAFSDMLIEVQADIVGRLNGIVTASLDAYDVAESDRILLPTGDGMCIGFFAGHGMHDIHLKTAKEILSRVHDFNTARENGYRFQVRIGVNQGHDIRVTDINRRANMAGRTINQAARIMALADGGQILAGRIVYESFCQDAEYAGKFRELETVDKYGSPLTVYQLADQGLEYLSTEIPGAVRNRCGEGFEGGMRRDLLAYLKRVGGKIRFEDFARYMASLGYGEEEFDQTVKKLTERVGIHVFDEGGRRFVALEGRGDE